MLVENRPHSTGFIDDTDFQEFARIIMIEAIQVKDIGFCDSPLFPLYADAVFPGCDIVRAKIAWQRYLRDYDGGYH